MNKKILLFLLAAVVIFLPLSNLMGLSGENEPIAVVAGSTPNFAKVSQVFQNKCVDCHSPGMTRMPIYAKLPIAKQLMEKDIANASSRLILSKQLYSGEAKFTPLELARLEGVIRNNSMPPHLYLSMHWAAKLSPEDKQIILTWIAEERAQLAWSIDSTNDLKGEPVQPLPINVSVDAQKIFNIINTGGTQLTAVEVSSAKPSWNIEIKNPSTKQSEETKKLYERIGVVSVNNVVIWDVPATLLNRLENAEFLFNKIDNKSDEKAHEKNVTLGFKLLAGAFRNSVKRNDIDDLSNKSKSEINWENDIEAFIADSNLMIKLISSSDYFKFFKSWKRPIVSLLSEAIALNFFLVLYKDFERKGKPTNNLDVKAKQFQKNSFILFDKLIYEYVLKEWRGSSDSKIANNLAKANKSTDVFEPLEKEKWCDLLIQIMDNNKLSDSDDLTQKMLEPILFHFYCLKNMIAPDSQYGYEVDHILPQAIFKQSTLLEKESIQHNLYNLALLPKDENGSKSSKTLNMITSGWLRNQIEKYTFIPMDKFSHFSDLGNLEDLKNLRKPIFLDAFGVERQKILDN
ncbi:MAG: hypothetical protein RIQ94_1403 [Pseudomonadota bacterium]